MRRFAIMLAVLSLAVRPAFAGPRQTVPDSKRQQEIRKALIAHGYPAGASWTVTQEILRGIAREHHWQHVHAPDARVLILLGLGNKMSDPQVLKAGPNHLDSTR